MSIDRKLTGSKQVESRVRLKLSILAATIYALGQGVPAIAQSGGGQEFRMDEVVVTARRREESLQEVPISINAFGEDYLRENSITSFDDIQNHASSMHITYNSADTIEPRVSIRGVMPNEARINDDPSSPMYFSDVVMTPATGTNLALYDLAMVQVLKGPQGTLFGRNSTAGAVLINPKLPGEELGGYVDFTVGNYDMYRTDFGVDLPVTERLQVRVAGRMHERDGYQTNKNDLPGFEKDFGKKLWDDNTKALRLSARWQPVDAVENVTIVEWSDKKSRARAAKAVVTGRSMFQDSIDRNNALSNPYDVRVNIISPENVENRFFSNTTTMDVGNLTFKNILGYRKTESFRQIDLDGMDAAVIQSRYDGTGDATKADQVSNEFQILGTAFDEKLDWVVGAYYYAMDGTVVQNTASGGGQIEAGDLDSTSYAIFGQGTFDFDNHWSLTIGARQSWDKRDAEISRFNNVLSVPPGGVCSLREADAGCKLSDSASFDASTWNASLSYKFTDDVMAYATIGTGYKSGGYNLRASSAAELVPFEEETVTSYELGLKADWSVGSWQIRSSLSVYRMDFEDIQVTVGECIDLGGPLCSVVTVKKNAAEATYQGAELEMNIQPSDTLMLNLIYGYVDPEYTKWLDIDSQGNVKDQSDRSFSFQPDHEFNASIKYIFPFDPSLGDISMLTSMAWRGSHTLTFDKAVIADPRYSRFSKQDAYHIVNFRIDWKNMLGSNFDISVFVNNVEGKAAVVSSTEQVRDNRDLFMTHTYGEPRTFGASLRYSF